MTTTPNLHLNLPDFNISPWHDELNENFRAIDAVIKSLFGIDGLLGEYKNSTAVLLGDRYFDVADGFFYETLSAFTTEASPSTFAQERIAYPARWKILDASAAIAAASTATAASVSAIAAAVSTAADAISTAANAVSTAADAATTSGNAATTAANAVSTAADAVATAADVIAIAGAAAATAADAISTAADVVSTATNAGTATTQATNAATSAGNAATSETNAGASETTASAAAGTAATDAISTAADAVQTDLDKIAAAASAAAAAISETNARAVLATEQVTTSGSSINFTGIPANTKKITIMLVGVSTTGSDDKIIQLGDAGGVETTGYVGNCAAIGATTVVTAYTVGFGVRSITSSDIIQAVIVLTLENAATNTWIVTIVGANSTFAAFSGGGSKSLSGELTSIRLTTNVGSDTFDAGAINIQYE